MHIFGAIHVIYWTYIGQLALIKKFLICLFYLLGKKADCTISVSDKDLLALMTGKLKPKTVRNVNHIFVFSVLHMIRCYNNIRIFLIFMVKE